MSILIKQARADVVAGRLPAARRSAVAVPREDARQRALETRIAELERTIEDERRSAATKLADARDEMKRAIAEAHAAGRAEAVAKEVERLALLKPGLADALTVWRERLRATDRLAVDLASAALARIFGDSGDLARLVTRTMAHHLDRLAGEGIVSVAVSAHDFADGAAVQALVPAGCRVERSTGLPAGACRIALRVGAVDLDPVAQWSVIEAALRGVAEQA